MIYIHFILCKFLVVKLNPMHSNTLSDTKKRKKKEYFLFWSLGTVLSQNMQLQYSNLLLITGEVGNVCKCTFLFVESILTLALRKTNEGLRRNCGFDGTASFKNKRCCRSSCTCLRRKIVQHFHGKL